MKKLFTLNRQLADRHTGENIGNVESYFCTFDIEEMQTHIEKMFRDIYLENKDKCALKEPQFKHYEITKRGEYKPFKTDYIYSFVIYTENTKALFSVEYHELQLSLVPMHDLDLR